MKLTFDAVREVLLVVGPLTSREVASYFEGQSLRNVSSALNGMRKRTSRRQVYIHSWTRDNGYGKHILRPVYALGNLPDARRPRAYTNAERQRRKRAKAARPKLNSVWALATGVQA